MRPGKLVRTITIVVACGAILLPMTSGGVAAAGSSTNQADAMARFLGPAEDFMSAAMYLRFKAIPGPTVGGLEGAMYASASEPAPAAELMLARANVSAMKDLCSRMAVFVKAFQAYAAEVPAAAALLRQAKDLSMKMDEVAMMRQAALTDASARNQTRGMLASVEPGGCLARGTQLDDLEAAEDGCMEALSVFKKNFDMKMLGSVTR